MATVQWQGGALAQAQVHTVTFTGGTWDAATTYKFTINGKTISGLGNVGGATTLNTLAAQLLILLQATTAPQEFKEITWSNPTGIITGTAVTAGKPFTLTTSVSGGTGTITSSTVTTTSSGPNDVGIAANWDTGNLPVNADTVIVGQGSSSLLYGLNQSAVALTSFSVLPGFTGTIGLPSINVDSASASYIEYRPTYLQYGCTAVTIQGGGGRLKLDNGSVLCTWNVLAKTQRIDQKIPQVLLKGTNAGNVLNVNTGDVAVGWFSEASTLLTLNVNFQANQAGDSAVWLGSNVTLTAPTIIQNGGTLVVNSAITGASVVTIYSGTFTIFGTGGIAAGLSVLGGTCIYDSTGTLGGTPVVAGTGSLDFSKDLRTKTVTNPIQMYGNQSTLLDPNKSITTFVVKLNKESALQNIQAGTDFTLTRS